MHKSRKLCRKIRITGNSCCFHMYRAYNRRKNISGKGIIAKGKIGFPGGCERKRRGAWSYEDKIWDSGTDFMYCMPDGDGIVPDHLLEQDTGGGCRAF